MNLYVWQARSGEEGEKRAKLREGGERRAREDRNRTEVNRICISDK